MCGLDITVTGLSACLGGIFSSVSVLFCIHPRTVVFSSSLLVNCAAMLLIQK